MITSNKVLDFSIGFLVVGTVSMFLWFGLGFSRIFYEFPLSIFPVGQLIKLAFPIILYFVLRKRYRHVAQGALASIIGTIIIATALFLFLSFSFGGGV